jgi:hypothetical protein
VEASEHEHKPEITLTIIYGVNKHLKVERTESIEKVKVGAMRLFDIPDNDQGSFVLKTKIDGHEEQLDEAKSVEHYHLHEDQKVTLAAGTPFGQR